MWKTHNFLASKRRQVRLNHERSFFENHRNCSPSELWASSTDTAYSKHSIAIHSISMAGCVNAVRAIVCFELPAREASSFCDIWKLTSCDFISFISCFIEVNLIFFFDMLIKDKFTYSVSKYESFWCSGFQWMSLWRSDVSFDAQFILCSSTKIFTLSLSPCHKSQTHLKKKHIKCYIHIKPLPFFLFVVLTLTWFWKESCPPKKFGHKLLLNPTKGVISQKQSLQTTFKFRELCTTSSLGFFADFCYHFFSFLFRRFLLCFVFN